MNIAKTLFYFMSVSIVQNCINVAEILWRVCRDKTNQQIFKLRAMRWKKSSLSLQVEAQEDISYVNEVSCCPTGSSII